MSKIHIDSDLINQIKTHAESAYPYECCGLLIGETDGQSKRLVTILDIENANIESPNNRFLIPPEAVMQGERQARADGLDLIGFYHSHPDTQAEPSEYDREHAWPWYSYIIVSVLKGQADEIRSWALHDDRSGYSEETVHQTTETPTSQGGL